MMVESPSMTLSRGAVLAFLQSHWDTLKAMGVSQIGLFGSYSRDEQYPGSDVDLLFRMDNMTFTRWMDVWNYLEDGLGVDVDLVPEQDLREEIRPQVLAEVVYVADKIARFVESFDAETFKADELRSDSVLYNLMIIGEAVKSLPDDMKSEAVRWRDIARFRDRVVHHYFGTNLDIVWEIATVHVPVLRTHVENLIEQLDESESPSEPE